MVNGRAVVGGRGFREETDVHLHLHDHVRIHVHAQTRVVSVRPVRLHEVVAGRRRDQQTTATNETADVRGSKTVLRRRD